MVTTHFGHGARKRDAEVAALAGNIVVLSLAMPRSWFEAVKSSECPCAIMTGGNSTRVCSISAFIPCMYGPIVAHRPVSWESYSATYIRIGYSIFAVGMGGESCGDFRRRAGVAHSQEIARGRLTGAPPDSNCQAVTSLPSREMN